MTRAELELTVKALLGIGLVALHYVLWSRCVREGWNAARIERTSWLIWLLTRPVLALLVFVVLDQPVTSDVAHYYVPQGLAALDGQLVYRDFSSSYGPLFPYAIAGLLSLVRAPEQVLFTSIALEGAAIALWARFARIPVTERARADALLLYACAPIALWTTTLAGQNQSWLSALLAVVVGALGRAAYGRATLALVAGGALVKALSFVPLPYVLALAAQRDRATLRRALLAFALGVLVFFGPFVWLGAPVWKPVIDQSMLTTSGNLPFLLSWLTGPARWSALPLVALVGTGMSVLLARRAASARPAAHHAALCALLLATLLVSRKAYTTYLVLFWLPACFVIAQQGLSRRVVLVFSSLSLAAMLEPALWFDWIRPDRLPRAFDLVAVRGPVYGVKVALFVACEIGLLAGYVWLLHRALRALVPSPPDARYCAQGEAR
jgi:hypothetical protein